MKVFFDRLSDLIRMKKEIGEKEVRGEENVCDNKLS
jgi:hypothetical protein